MSIAFLLTTLVVVATPGTGVVYTLAAALSRGRRASVVAAVGCTLGIVPHLLATVTGVAALLHASATAFQVLKYAGVAYLLYMAWATLRDKDALAVEEGEPAPLSARRVIVRGVLINILNPKLTMFFFAFLPQFVSPGEPHALVRMAGLGGVFMLVTFLVFAAYGLLAASVRSQVLGRPRVMAWLRRGFAGSFVALGAKLAVTAR
ncbi:LysE family translocator [Streptomyces sp. Go-475]|uniref:LysE family translocator n=1 Tax=Streptomyces sp. Go-475 TaxID=2072505 RepID=UPI000DEF67AC|nr:LysE family translocator [Streptomyces sp. Go-475]AXE85757.1 Homoserine/homoserine lactone efflux protein [Streptomyces sp. Go-475]